MNENGLCGNVRSNKNTAAPQYSSKSYRKYLFYQDVRQPTPAKYQEMEYRMIFENPSDQGACVIVGANVREVLKALGWGQVTLGRKASLRQGYISAIERGDRCPSLERLFDLARAFDVAPSRLVRTPMTDAREG